MQYDTIETRLHLLGIEYRDVDKYYTRCPKCADAREKEGTRSLLVTRDDVFVRYQCMHAQQCEWNTRQFFRIPNAETLYSYKNVNGVELFRVLRIDNPDGSKVIRPMLLRDGRWIFEGYKGKALFNADKLNDATKTVLVVEGEKTALAAEKIFTKCTVVTWPGGACGVHRGDWTLLNNRRIVLWPDNDEAGIKAMNEVVQLIRSDDISIIDPSSLPRKSDLADPIPHETIIELWQNRKQWQSISSPVGAYYTPNLFIQSLSTMEAGLRCYFTDSFSTDLRLPQSGLVIIGGRTSHGKTSLMVNMLVSFLKAEVQRKVIYYSLEIPASRLILKILMTLSQESYSQSQVENFNIYRQKILDGQLPAWDNISKLLGDRLLINDEPISISSLVSRLDCESNHGALVFIDYIQLIGSDSKDQRYLAIKHFADSLRAVANKRGMVVIGGSQLTAGETAYSDSVREGKDLEMAAELVLRCWNKQVARANGAIRKDEGDYYADIPGNFVINVCKNRSGVAGAKFGFDFDGFVLKHVEGL
jgi:hypothetical protein